MCRVRDVDPDLVAPHIYPITSQIDGQRGAKRLAGSNIKAALM